jgi:hypothetical protein
MASIYEIHFPLTSAVGGGPPPPGSQDHFAPKYLVGNVPKGDSATAYSSGGFQYIPDTGNGAGIAAAIAAATASPGDIWIRPGTYNLTSAGAPASPYAVPSGVLVRGAGNSTVINGRLTGNQTVFTLATTSELRDLRINVIGEFNSILGDGVVECNGSTSSPSRVERVDIQLSNLGGSTLLKAAILAGKASARIVACRFFLPDFDEQSPTGGVSGVQVDGIQGFASVSRCLATRSGNSFGCAYVAFGGARLDLSESSSSFASLAGVLVSGGGLAIQSRVSVSECNITSQGSSCIVSDGTIRVSDCDLSALQSNAILSTGRGVITGNTVLGAMDTSGGSNHVITTNFFLPTATLLPSATDEVAHNVFA